ncbi:ribonuclease H-like domain-containing protein [Tanacetum coccineum]
MMPLGPSEFRQDKDTGIFSGAYDDEVEGAKANFNNFEPTIVRLVDLPKCKHAIGTKWVYRNKKDNRWIVIRNKARLVAQGYTQEEEIDYDQVFAPVAKIKVISQDKYVVEILKKFDFSSVETTSTSIETNKAWLKDKEVEDVYVHLYRSMIGSLMYLTTSRSDIMFVVCACARDSPFDLEAFPDSDYARASLDKKPITGGCQFLGKRQISWQCKKQIVVANSTTKPEYVAAANCSLVDGKKIIVNEASIRHDLRLDDAEDGFSGDVTSLFDSMMVQVTEEVDEASYHPLNQPSTSSKPQKKQKSRRRQRNEVESPQVESEDEDNVPTYSNDPLPSGEDSSNLNELMAKKIASLKKTVKKLKKKRRSRLVGLRRLKRIGAARKSKSSKDKDNLGDQEDSSKQGRNIEDIDQDEAQVQLDEEMFGVDDHHGEEVTIEDIAAKVIVQDIAAPITAAETITTAETVTAAKEVTTVSGPTTTTIDELTLAQTLIEIAAKSKKVEVVTTAAATRPKAKGIVFHEHEQSHKPTVYSTQPSSKDKGKGIMIEPEKPLKRKDQVVADEEYARQLAAEMEAELAKEERVRRQKEEANLALIELWETKQAMMEADRLLAERIQSREREELTIKEKSKLFVELMNKGKKHFAELRAQEKRNKPPTKSQKRNQMSTYLKHMGTYKHSHLKNKTYEEIERLFEIEMKRVNTFISMDQDVKSSKKDKVESKSKRAGEELESNVSKKQKVTEQVETKKNVEVEEDDTEELKNCLEIVPEDEDDVTVDATPLSSRSPSIVDCKIYKEGKKKYF